MKNKIAGIDFNFEECLKGIEVKNVSSPRAGSHVICASYVQNAFWGVVTASKNKFQKMQPTICSESCFPGTGLQRRDADDALVTRTFARAHKSSTNLMVSAPGHAAFGPNNDLQVGKRELCTNSKI